METNDHRKARLRKAAGDAIERAIATGECPFELMKVVTGEGSNICVPYVQQHPLFQEKRRQFKTHEERMQEERAAREAAAVEAAEATGCVVWVRRQFDSHKHAAYRFSDMSGWHWSDVSGGTQKRANRQYLHAYVMCDAMIAGELSHSCAHGPGPHRIKVCVTKTDNKKSWKDIEEAAQPALNARPGRAWPDERSEIRCDHREAAGMSLRLCGLLAGTGRLGRLSARRSTYSNRAQGRELGKAQSFGSPNSSIALCTLEGSD